MGEVLVYMTAGSEDEARRIGSALVAERLAACVNLIPGMRSMYWWDGAVQSDPEIVVLAKTREDLVSALSERVRALHSYECACVVALPIRGGNPPFLKWIAQETQNGGA